MVSDLVAQPGVEEIVCLKGAQIGWSELCRNLTGYWVDLDPGPILVVASDQKAAEDFRDERIEPLIKNTKAVARHSTARAWDATKHRIKFDTCSLFFTWAGSKSGVKTRPIRYLICEEPDEWPPFSSTGGDPLAKALKRITTYSDKGRARVLIGGTPTTRTGNTWKRWEMCAVRYHLWVPCPHCNAYQLLTWKQVKWPDLPEITDRAKRAAKIKQESLAHYECEHCKAAIHDHQKPRMLMRGVWSTEDQVVTPDGRVVGPAAQSVRVGVKVSSLYSLWVKFGTLAAEWIESQGDPNALCDFVNQRLAEPFEEQRAKTEPNFIAEKAKNPALVVPNWTRALIATADTQGADERSGYFWYAVRAWGYDYRSQLIDFGVCTTRDELKQRCLNRQFELEGGGQVTPSMLLVDSGGPRWNEVYQLAQSDPRIHPTKGSANARTWMVEEKPQRQHGVVLWLIDTDQSKDLLHSLIHDTNRDRWVPHNAVNADYCQQLSSETKVYDPQSNREVWTNPGGRANHLWDCEHQQCAAAWRLGCGAPEPQAAQAKPADDSRVTPSDWLSRGRGKW
jgi:phage terminase large subunit GpA-like protein